MAHPDCFPSPNRKSAEAIPFVSPIRGSLILTLTLQRELSRESAPSDQTVPERADVVTADWTEASALELDLLLRRTGFWF